MPGLEYCKKITTTTYQATPDDATLLCDAATAGGTITVTLPATAQSNGQQICIKKKDSGANTVVINTKSGDTVQPGGGTSFTLVNQGDYVEVTADGTSSGVWYVEDAYVQAATGFAWIPPAAIQPSGTATLTRNAQGDWSWNVASSQTVTFLIPLSNLVDFVTTTNKGAMITSVDISESIITNSVPTAGHTYTVLTTVYAQGVANGVSSVANSGVPPLAASGASLPWLTNVPFGNVQGSGTPTFFNTPKTSMMLEVAIQTSGGTYRLNGVGVNYTLAASPLGYAE